MSTQPNDRLSPIVEGFYSWLNRHRWGRFELRRDGVYYTEYDDIPDPGNPDKTKRIARPEKICSWLEVAAMSRDENSLAWGKVLRWTDHDGKLHQWSTPAPLLVKNSTELVETLAGEGLSITHGKGARVKEYIDTVHPTERCRNVPRTGWYTMPNTGARVFVLPDRVIGEEPDGEAAVYQPESPDSTHQPVRAGSLEEWQKHVAAYCRGNNILTFAVSMGFAGPVLDLLNEPSGGFHLRGHSSKGKTTALASGASVWGHPIATWRTTDNALEDTAERHNDVLLALDELSMLDPRNAVNVAYMLGNGEGKGRSTPTGEAQRKKHWRVLFLSTGEISLVDHAASVGMRSKAGTEMRMVEIDSDAGKGMGVFEFIHEFESSSQLLPTTATSFIPTPMIGVW